MPSPSRGKLFLAIAESVLFLLPAGALGGPEDKQPVKKGQAVAGQVVSAETDRPIAGARVLVVSPSMDMRSYRSGARFAREVRTDEKGQFRVELPLTTQATCQRTCRLKDMEPLPAR